MTDLEVFSSYITRLTIKNTPDSTIRKLKDIVLDVLECAYDADVQDIRIRSSLKSCCISKPFSTLWGGEGQAFTQDAMFFNAVRASVSYRNDLVRRGGIHAGAIVLSTIFALAENKNDVKAEDILVSILVGYEAMGRLSRCLKLNPAERMSAFCGSFGVAAAASKFLKLTHEQTVSALSFATHFTGGNNQWGSDGTGEDVYQAGWATRNGIQATSLAIAGGIGTSNALDGKNGLLAALSSLERKNEFLKDLGVQYVVDEVEFKPIEGCIMIQSPGQLASQFCIDPSKIYSVIIHVPRQALFQSGCDSLVVTNSVTAKMNIRYAVACKLMGIRIISFNPPYKEKVLELMKKCELVEDENATALFPKRIPCRIDISLLNGEKETKELDDFEALTEDELIERFRLTALKCKTSEEIERMINSVMNFEKIVDLKGFIASL